MAQTSSFISIPATAAAGGLVFTQPPQTAAASFYKIAPSQPITFGWNFTSLIVSPVSLTVSAVCTDNGNTYPVGPSDGVIPGDATEVVWDVYSYQQAHQTQPLAQATYTLSIWDERGSAAPRRGGFLQPNSGMRFALYTPQPYTPLSDGWSCPGCQNGAFASLRANPLFVALLATFAIMFLSGWRLLRHHV